MTNSEVVSVPGLDDNAVILVVEDEVLVRFVTAEMLRDEGYVVLEAADASEALALMATGHPLDLVLTDIRMPGELDGVGLTREIKQARPHLPILIVTSHLPEDGDHAGDGFLAKPFEHQQLLERVGEMIGSEWKQRRSSPRAS